MLTVDDLIGRGWDARAFAHAIADEDVGATIAHHWANYITEYEAEVDPGIDRILIEIIDPYIGGGGWMIRLDGDRFVGAR